MIPRRCPPNRRSALVPPCSRPWSAALATGIGGAVVLEDKASRAASERCLEGSYPGLTITRETWLTCRSAESVQSTAPVTAMNPEGSSAAPVFSSTAQCPGVITTFVDTTVPLQRKSGLPLVSSWTMNAMKPRVPCVALVPPIMPGRMR